MGNSNKKAGRAPTSADTATGTIVPVENDIIDRWIKLRTERAHSPVAYTPASKLYTDFQRWHESTFPADPVPNDKAFAEALRGAPRVALEMLPVARFGNGTGVGLAANLTLLPALRDAA